MTVISRTEGTHGLVVTFIIDDQQFGLDLMLIERVIRAVEVTPLPDAPANVLGVVNLQGRVIPVFDLRGRFGFRMRAIGLDDHFLIARASRYTVALFVDAVLGIIEWNETTLIPAAEILSGIHSVEGVVKMNGDIILIHDLKKFLSLEETRQLETALSRSNAGVS